MKEQDPGNNREGLTNQPNPFRLGVKGDIFMADPGTGEGQPQSPKTAKEAAQKTGDGESVILQQFGKIGLPQEVIEDPIFQAFAEGFARSAGKHVADLSKDAILKRYHTYREKRQREEAQESRGAGGAGGQPPEDKSPVAGGEGENGEGAEINYSDPRIRNIFEEISNAPLDMNTLHRFLDRLDRLKDAGGVGELSEAGKQEANDLSGRLYEYIKTATNKDNRYGPIKDRLNAAGNQKEKDKILIEIFRGEYVSGSSLDPNLIEIILDNNSTETLDYLVNRIISEPLDAETAEYQLSFYGGINFSLIREAVKARVEGLRREGDIKKASEMGGIYQKYELLKMGAQLTHTMNSKVITGDLENFVGVARLITNSSLQTLQRQEMVGTVMRLYEEELMRVRVRDGIVDSKNYAEVVGTIFDEEGNPSSATKGTVESLLEKINLSRPEEERLDEWQLKWAFYLGRNMMNITLRAAEIISQSRGDTQGGIGYKSFPQESAARIIDPINLTGIRFGIVAQRGGIKLAEMIKEKFEKLRGFRGWEKSKLKNVTGMDLKEFESRGILEIVGVWSGWRQKNIIFINNPDNPKEMISIENYLAGKESKGTPGGLRDVFLDSRGELRKEFTHSLGVLLKTDALIPDDKDSANTPGILAAKREVRAAIWKRIAEENPLSMANILKGMEFIDGSDLSSLNERLNALDQLLYTKNSASGKTEITKYWSSLWGKLVLIHETRMMLIAGGKIGGDVSFDKVMQDLIKDGKIENLSEKEDFLLAEIRSLGRLSALELANVRFPSNPIMNDIIFERSDYSASGEEMFRRRLGGDIPSMNQGATELIKIMDNPSSVKPTEVLEAIHKIVQGLGVPQGIEVAQNNVFPLVLAYMDFIATKSGEKQFFVNAILHTFRQPTSIAQEFGDMGAPSANELELFHYSRQALDMGVLRRGRMDEKEKGKIAWTDLFNECRERTPTKKKNILWAYMRDWLILFFIGLGIDIARKTNPLKD